MKLKYLLDEVSTPSVFKKFFKAFPTNAKKWSEATDEIRDLTRYIRTFYNEVILDIDQEGEDDPKGIKALNWRSFNTPSEWNTKGQQQIIQIYNMLDDRHKKMFIDEYAKHYFPNYF